MTGTSTKKRLEALEAALADKAGEGDAFTMKLRAFCASLSTPDLRRLVEVGEMRAGGAELDAGERAAWERLDQLWQDFEIEGSEAL